MWKTLNITDSTNFLPSMAVTFPNRAQKPYSLDFITFTLHPRKLTNPKAVLTANKETEKKKECKEKQAHQSQQE